jgi:diadenosine tetraphosphate (Ap4A) HIT family hydrolase
MLTSPSDDTRSYETCAFCIEFRTGICSLLSPPKSRILFENENFVAFPSLGSFVEGYLLLCPKIHVPSCASLDSELLTELAVTLTEAKAILKNHYQAPILFEHGLASCSQRAGACVEHAHIHLVAANVDIVSTISKTFSRDELSDIRELRAWRGQPYLLVQNIDGLPVVARVPDSLPSQYLRREVATALGVPDQWDWGAYLGLSEIHSTINEIKSSFGL